MSSASAPPGYRNYRFLFQLWFRIRAGRAGTSALIPTERTTAPQVSFIFLFVAACMIAIGLLASMMWLWIIGGLVLALTIVYLVWPASPTASYSDGHIRTLKTGGPGGRQKRTFDRIGAKDPEFDGAELLQRVRRAYLLTHEAWNEQRLGLIRPFVSDGVFERFRMASAELAELGERPRMRDPRVVQCFVIHGYAEEKFDVNTMRIDVMADAERVDDSGALVELPILGARYTEYWSFVRRAEARTHKGRPGLLEGSCPNCGAAVEVNQAASCGHCGVTLRSGEHDWVLVEVTQMGRWRSVDPAHIPGVVELQQADPCFSVACFEDRAAVVFWRLEEAARTADTGSLGGGLSPALRDLYAARLRPGMTPPELESEVHKSAADEYQYVGQRLVEAVDTLGIQLSADRQRALVSVPFRGHIFSRRAGGSPERRGEYQGRTLLLFERPVDAATELARGLSSAHCPSCGGPHTGGGVCTFCNAPIANADGGWTLVATSHLAPEGISVHAIEQELLRARQALRSKPRG